MNEQKIGLQYGGKLLAATLGLMLIAASPLQAAVVFGAAPAKTPVAAQPIHSGAATTEVAPFLELFAGQSHLIKLPGNARLAKVSVDNPKVVQVSVTSLSEVVLHAKSAGTATVMLRDKSGQTTVVDVTVMGGEQGKTAIAVQSKLSQMLPGERNIRVVSVADSIALTGTVSDAVKVERAVALAEAFGAKKVLNFLQTSSPQQVMLEVKVAEVSKTLTDALGAQFKSGAVSGGWTYSLLAGFLTGSGNNITIANGAGTRSLTLDAAKQDQLVKILAEPTIMAMSGQEGSFLAGGSIYIPVPQAGVGGGTIITLEQKDFGVALKFTPTVLEGGRINLKVAPEFSEFATAVTTPGTSIPNLLTRRATTTVQLNDGQSFAIGGLIKNNVTANIRAFPGLGELPIIGALFRSTAFTHDRSELVFVITPRLVKPLPPGFALPTDAYIQPSRGEYLLQGKLEGAAKAEPKPVDPATPVVEPAPAGGGFQMK